MHPWFDRALSSLGKVRGKKGYASTCVTALQQPAALLPLVLLLLLLPPPLRGHSS
jgi:hypothetical protein